MAGAAGACHRPDIPPLLEGIVCWLIIRYRLPGFTLRRGMDAAFVGTFGNVVGLGAGAVPMESYYLYHCGLPLGPPVWA